MPKPGGGMAPGGTIPGGRIIMGGMPGGPYHSSNKLEYSINNVTALHDMALACVVAGCAC